jgi:hypothetical protein
MIRCIGRKRDGSPCKATVETPDTLCWWHSPDHAEQRSRIASKAGKGRGPSGELAELRALIRQYMTDVEKGRLDKGKGSVLAQLAGVAGRLYEVERKVKETEELARELSELKELVNNRRSGTWAG